MKTNILVLLVFAAGIASAAIVTGEGILVPVPCPCDTCLECNSQLASPECLGVYLTADLLSSKQVCIDATTTATNKYIDCRGFLISPLGIGIGEAAIQVSAVSGFELDNCTISGFPYAVRMIAVSDSDIHDNNLSSNSMGLDMLFSISNRIYNNSLTRNNVFGAHFDSTSTNNEFDDNQVCYNGIDIIDEDTTTGVGNTCDSQLSIVADTTQITCSNDCTDPGVPNSVTVTKVANVTEVYTGQSINWSITVVGLSLQGIGTPGYKFYLNDTNNGCFPGNPYDDFFFSVTYQTVAGCDNITNEVTVVANTTDSAYPAHYSDTATEYVTVIHCGNDICDCLENCSSCEADCGECGGDITPPNLSWNWTDINSTITANWTYLCVNASETLDNCTFNVAETGYDNLTDGTNLCYNVTDLANGNYTTNATCYDLAGNDASLLNAWINVSVTSCTPDLQNTTWGDWSNDTLCLINDTQRQVQNLTQYDANECGEIANETFYNYTWVACDYCTPSLANTTFGAWSNYTECYANNTQQQVQNLTQYDNNSCGEGANQSFYNYTWAACDYVPYCGDDICNGDETCSSCSEDCGSCRPDECSRAWVCSDWSECTSGYQTRSCRCGCSRDSDCYGDHDERKECSDEACDTDCNDGNPCTDDSCSSGECKNEPNTRSCSDGDECTKDDICSEGSCSGISYTCDDSNVCTDDSCDGSGCTFTPNTRSCNDGDECTKDDICSEGSCSGISYTCDDSNVCTDDSCDGGCVSTPNTRSCSDGDACTQDDHCEDSRCVSGENTCNSGCDSDRDCDDGDPSTIDECVGGSCEHTPIEDLESALGGEAPNWTEPEAYEEESYTLIVSVYPDVEVYVPGQKIETATVTITDSSGAPVDGAEVSGLLNGTDLVSLDFEAAGNGIYRAQVGYIISSDENSLLSLQAHATISGQSKNATKYLITGSSKYFYLVPEKPKETEAAPGQILQFQCMISKKSESDNLEDLQVILIDERTDEQIPMLENGASHYATELQMKKNIHDSAYFIVLATATVNGVERTGAYRVVLTRKPILSITFDKERQDVQAGVFEVDIKFIDASNNIVGDPEVFAVITGFPSGEQQTLVLKRATDSFLGIYKSAEGDTSAKLQVSDSYDNAGEAFIPPEFFVRPAEFPAIYALALFVIALGFFLGTKFYSRAKAKRASAKLDRNKLLVRKAELENLIKRTRDDFYKRALTQEEADVRIREYEEELKLVEAKING